MILDQKTATETLEQIFLQAIHDEEFYSSLSKIGVRFSDWPEMFRDAKKFERIAAEKTFLAARVAVEIEVPEEFYSLPRLSLSDVKSLHQSALDILNGVELGRRLLANPHRMREILDEANGRSRSPTAALRLFEVIEQTVKATEARIQNNEAAIVLKGFPKLSELMDGFNPGRVSIFTAPTGFGKTNLGLALFCGAIESGLKSLFVNMEMAVEDIGKRLMQTKAHMSRQDFRKPEYIQKITQAGVLGWAINNSDFWITDGRSMSLSEIAKLISRIKREQSVSIVFIDYDQKIEMTGKDEEWRFLQKAVQDLEEMAKREGVHVVLFSQANDDGLPRASLRAMQPASAVVYFHKDDEQFKLKFLKNRFGPTDQVLIMNYQPEVSLITESHLESIKRIPELSKKATDGSDYYANLNGRRI